jgi:hypothetical protein
MAGLRRAEQRDTAACGKAARRPEEMQPAYKHVRHMGAGSYDKIALPHSKRPVHTLLLALLPFYMQAWEALIRFGKRYRHV